MNRAALAAHRRLLAEHGGATGVDLGRLCVVLGWPKTVLAFAERGASVYELASSYAEAVLHLRPFASGNERMAYLFALMFLTINGAALPASAQEKVAMFRTFAMGVIDRAKWAQWMLLRTVAQGGGTAVGVRRNAQGKVTGVGLVKAGAAVAAPQRRLRGSPLRSSFHIPMLQN
jgi:prophage maintenance system killer protein